MIKKLKILSKLLNVIFDFYWLHSKLYYAIIGLRFNEPNMCGRSLVFRWQRPSTVLSSSTVSFVETKEFTKRLVVSICVVSPWRQFPSTPISFSRGSMKRVQGHRSRTVGDGPNNFLVRILGFCVTMDRGSVTPFLFSLRSYNVCTSTGLKVFPHFTMYESLVSLNFEYKDVGNFGRTASEIPKYTTCTGSCKGLLSEITVFRTSTLWMSTGV